MLKLGTVCPVVGINEEIIMRRDWGDPYRLGVLSVTKYYFGPQIGCIKSVKLIAMILHRDVACSLIGLCCLSLSPRTSLLGSGR